MTHHYLVFVPYQADGREVRCWLERSWTVVAMGCSCGTRLRDVSIADLGLDDLTAFYGEPTDEALDRLQAEYDLAHLVDLLDPTVLTLQPEGDRVLV
ncbi:hypothetical protein [Modestobacter sp. KNN46-3]|uniref:hypothetical protein n=1 Tax=Modestobacter sp. KNN46-3 TaxID=2711218 RepID=UPI0013DF8D96|nr:hypothetical protein [Modestobacter sp. KNN46-3]